MIESASEESEARGLSALSALSAQSAQNDQSAQNVLSDLIEIEIDQEEIDPGPEVDGSVMVSDSGRGKGIIAGTGPAPQGKSSSSFQKGGTYVILPGGETVSLLSRVGDWIQMLLERIQGMQGK